MSRSVRYDWQIQAEIRRQMHLTRVRETVAQYYDRHRRKLRELTDQGLEQYLPQEFKSLRSSLMTLSNLLSSDPEQARALSMEIGGELSVLPGLARAAERESKVRERERQAQVATMRKEANSELGRHLNSLILGITDPIERDFAFEDLHKLLAEHASRAVDPGELSNLKEGLVVAVKAIRRQASQQAADWKRKGAKDTEVEAQSSLVDLHIEELERDAERSPKAIKEVLAKLQGIRATIGTSSRSMSELQKEISDAVSHADAIIVDENCRRATVRAVLGSLQRTGFVVGTPQRQQGDRDEVVISARKPAGSEAVFRVTTDGGMTFKFDHYEGSRCKADIEQVLPMLQEVYGVKLSNERVLWENPDRISQSTQPVDAGSKDQHRG